jgi:hypothetical protein
MQNLTVALKCVFRIINLSFINADNKVRLGACGACEAVVSTVTIEMSLIKDAAPYRIYHVITPIIQPGWVPVVLARLLSLQSRCI